MQPETALFHSNESPRTSTMFLLTVKINLPGIPRFNSLTEKEKEVITKTSTLYGKGLVLGALTFTFIPSYECISMKEKLLEFERNTYSV